MPGAPIPPDSTGATARAVLTVARDAGGPPHGRLEEDRGDPVEFYGWLELMAAVERLRAEPPKDT